MQKPYIIKNVYGTYFQKSLTFLYPVLGHKMDQPFKPIGSYISWDKRVHPEDRKLLVVYGYVDHPHFQIYEKEALLNNAMYAGEFYALEDGSNVYVFTFDHYKKDWQHFLAGQYSLLSPLVKKRIRLYRGRNSLEYAMLHSYLFPDQYHELYAELLNVDITLIRDVAELANQYHPEKENLKAQIALPKKQFLLE